MQGLLCRGRVGLPTAPHPLRWILTASLRLTQDKWRSWNLLGLLRPRIRSYFSVCATWSSSRHQATAAEGIGPSTSLAVSPVQLVREGLAFSSGLRSSPPKLLAASEAPASAASFSPVHAPQASVQDAARRAPVSAPRGGLKKPQPIVPAECNQPAKARDQVNPHGP